jgi:DNA-binding MarR family transcriptional regulator
MPTTPQGPSTTLSKHKKTLLDFTAALAPEVDLTMVCYKDQSSSVESLREELRLPAASAEATLRSLREREWVQESAEGWEVTAQGRDIRDNIEHETNEFNAQPFIALDDERQVRLLHGLRSLPDSGS